ncbi:MAG: 1-deoxy-D-xylulose-5-phosphate synthase [Bacteroidales bacterium]|nr:1-deoxy-D-xylulose-5-phosphate synthase [Bacteroidales bacterium]
MSILDSINSPADLKKLPIEKLPEVCAAVRQTIIDDCAMNPGHVGSSLGVVELTVALHYVLDLPYDNLIWDVGHQSYAHKILTGRREQFKNKRKKGGISGFPKMEESEFDTFGTGHSSTSISAALGMAEAARLTGQTKRQSVAVIGDGSMTGGMAFEALNNAGISKANMLIILNDNNMAIDPNVGALKNYLLDITASQAYNRIKHKVWDSMNKKSKIMMRIRGAIKKHYNNLKSTLLKHSNLFEAMGVRYFGPLYGHDVIRMVHVLQRLTKLQGPKLLHCITIKGYGFDAAEEKPTLWHSPSRFDPANGELLPEPENESLKFQDVFGETLLELARQNDKIVGITPAMPTGCSMNIMMKAMPERCFDVGIAEPHAVTFSAGLAAKGMIPFCNIYSSFMQRAYDQIIHDIALQKLNVVLCQDRGGLVGSDGATHHGVFDLAILQHIPNLTIAAPMNEHELRNMMYTAQLPDMGPFSIRYPRGHGFLGEAWRNNFEELEVGKARCLSQGKKVAVLTIGTTGHDVAKVINNFEQDSIAHYDMRFLKPIDEDVLKHVFTNFKTVITIEDGTITGGLAGVVALYKAKHNFSTKLISLGVPDRFISHGTISELKTECGFDKESIEKVIRETIA